MRVVIAEYVGVLEIGNCCTYAQTENHSKKNVLSKFSHSEAGVVADKRNTFNTLMN